jgi:type IV secretory pathway protease TraF
MRRKSQRTVLGLIGGFGLTTALAAAWAAGLRWNGTPSYPLGLWRIVARYDPAHGRGSIVLFCAPDLPLMRSARVAVPGDRVTVTPRPVLVWEP